MRQIECVTWRDAYFIRDEDNDETYEEYLMQTVGWTGEEKNFLVVRHEYDRQNDNWRAVTRIPWAMIVERRVLEEVRDADSRDRVGSPPGGGTVRGREFAGPSRA